MQDTEHDLSGGTRDGAGASDQDLPYRFGRRPTTEQPYPFSTRQFARLLTLRGRIRADQFEQDGAAG
jgi:hypothetical protein